MGRHPRTTDVRDNPLVVIVNICGSGAYLTIDSQSFPPDGYLERLTRCCRYMCNPRGGVRPSVFCANSRRKSRRLIQRNRLPRRNLWSRLDELILRLVPYVQLMGATANMIVNVPKILGLIS